MKKKFDGTVSLSGSMGRGTLLYGEAGPTRYGVNVCSGGVTRVIGRFDYPGDVQLRFTKTDLKDPQVESIPLWFQMTKDDGLHWTNQAGRVPGDIFMGSMESWLRRLTGIKIADGKRKLYVTGWKWE